MSQDRRITYSAGGAVVWVLVVLALAGAAFFAYQEAAREKARVAFCEEIEDVLIRTNTLMFDNAGAALKEAEVSLGRLGDADSSFHCDAALTEKASSIASMARIQPICATADRALTLLRGYVKNKNFGQGLHHGLEFDSNYVRLVEERAHCLGHVDNELRGTKQSVSASLWGFFDESAVLAKPVDFESIDAIVAAWGNEQVVSRWRNWRRLLDSGQALPVVVKYADWPGVSGPLMRAPKEAKLPIADKRRVASQVQRLLGVPFVLYGASADERIAENVRPLILEVNAKWKTYKGEGPWHTSVATDLRLTASYGSRKMGSATAKDDVPEKFEIKTRHGVAPQAMIRDSESKFKALLEDLDRQGAFDDLKETKS